MKNWLIKLLGGFTREEFESSAARADSRIEAFDEQIQHWHELLESREKEIRRISDLIFTHSGFLPSESKTSEAQPKPINNRMPWPQRQKELEKEDARKLADETERRWKNGDPQPGYPKVSTRNLENEASKLG
jgi:restriction endonuclease S subunit